MESQNLDGGNFPDALIDVDVDEVIQHHHRQHARSQNDEPHDRIQGADHLPHGVGIIAAQQHRHDAVHIGNFRTDLLGIRRLHHGHLQLRVFAPLRRHGLRGDDGEVLDIVLINAADSHVKLLHVGIAQDHLIANADAHGLADTHGEQCLAGTGLGHKLSVVAHVDEVRNAFICAQHGNLTDLVMEVHFHGFLMVEKHIIHSRNRKGRHIPFCLSAIKIDFQIVSGDVLILVGHDVGDGILQSEARQQQSCAAADADEHHQETLAVAENIPQGHLVEEAQFIPERQVFQEDLLAGGRRLGADQLRRDLLEGAVAAVPCHRQHHNSISQRHRCAQFPVKLNLNIRGDVEHAAVGIPDNLGDKCTARQHTQAAAQNTAGTGVDQVLAHYGRRREAQCLQGTDLGALLSHHAAHSGDAHQGRDKQEEGRQDPGHALDDLGIAFQSCITHIGVTVQNVGLRGLQIVNFLPGICQFDGSVRQLCFRIGNGLLRLQLALFIFDPAVSQFCLTLFQLAAAIGQLLFAGIQGGPAVFDLLFAVFDLFFRLGEFLVRLGLALFPFGVAIIDGLLGIRQSLPGLQQFLPLGSQLFPCDVEFIELGRIFRVHGLQFFQLGSVLSLHSLQLRQLGSVFTNGGIQLRNGLFDLSAKAHGLGGILLQCFQRLAYISFQLREPCQNFLCLGGSLFVNHAGLDQSVQLRLRPVDQAGEDLQRGFQQGDHILSQGRRFHQAHQSLPCRLSQRGQQFQNLLQLVNAVGDLGQALLQLGDAVRNLGQILLQLTNAIFHLRQTIFKLDKTIIQLCKAVFHFRCVGIQLRLAVGKLGVDFLLFFGQLLLAVGKFLLGLFQLLFAVGDLLFAVIQKFFVVSDLPLGIHELVVGISQFLLGVQLALFQLSKTVQILPVAVGVFRFGLVQKVPEPSVGDCLYLGLQPGGHVVHGAVVVLGIDREIAGDGHVDLGVIVRREALRRDVKIALDGTAAHCGGAAVLVHVEWRRHVAHDGISIIGQRIKSQLLIVVRQRHLCAEDGVIEVEAVGQTFVGALGHPSAPEGDLIDPFRDGIEAVNRILPGIPQPDDGILIIGCFHPRQALQLFQLLDLVVCPAVGTEKTQIKHILLICKDLSRLHHIHLGHQQADEQRRAQRNNQHDGQVTSKGTEDGLGQVFRHNILFHHHSISRIS